MNLKGHSPINFIIHERRFIEIVFIILVVLSLINIPMVGVNYDLTKYLPDSSDASQAIDILDSDFTYPGIGRVMLNDVTIYEAKAIKDRIADVEGVDTVMWCDTSENIYGASTFLNYKDIEDYYKDNTAYMEIAFAHRDSSSITHRAVKEIEAIIGDRGMVAGSAAADTILAPTLNAQIMKVFILAVIVIFLILALTTTSWFEPVLFLSVMGIAIVLNMGSNIIFGEISFMSNSVGAILQLACSIDYSIFLLDAFTKEKANGVEPEQAMANALRAAVVSISSSGATTIVGFLALCLMIFGIGSDLGLVLAKGIALSLLTVLLLMPALILRFQNMVKKFEHRSFMPSFRKFGEFAYRIRIPFGIAVLLLVPPCFVAQGMSNFSYGNESLANSPGTYVYDNDQAMNAKFGMSNQMIALVPVGDNVTETRLTERLKDLDYVKYVESLSEMLPEGLPEEFLPNSVTSQLHSEKWARIIVCVRSGGESDAAFTYCDEIKALVSEYYPNQKTYVIGTTAATEDIKTIITADYSRVNVISLIGVALVVAITFKSLVLPLVVLIPIEAAVYLNTAVPYITGIRSMFLGFIVVSCIQLGATIDYSILMTNNYLNARAQADKKEAAIRAVTESAQSVLTSASILSICAYGLYYLSSIDAIGGLGHLIGRGALCSMVLVLLMLPACLMLFDRFIVRPDFAQRKHARMNKIRATALKHPAVSALHQQRARLHEALKENRRARRKVIYDRFNKIMGKTPEATGEAKPETKSESTPDSKPDTTPETTSAQKSTKEESGHEKK